MKEKGAQSDSTVILLGASTRAAAMSALRAGRTPWCADLFADVDLERIATVRKVSAAAYPDGLLDALADAPPGPVIYTGALENRPDLIARIDRALWGNSPEVLRAIRSPERWTQCLELHRIPCPAVSKAPEVNGAWILKPRRSAGGYAVREYKRQTFNPRTHFLQERIEGKPCSAVFVADRDQVMLLGITRQLIGTPWLNATGFHYAGSVGPLPISETELQRWRELGTALGQDFQLRGLFGIDAMVRDGVPWPVEINPRYTASVEILERACQGAYLLHHAAAFAATAPAPAGAARSICGKAILFARKTFSFPTDGPWVESLEPGGNLDSVEHADIPRAGEIIEAGRPVLTVFASASTVHECETKLREKAQALDRRLCG
ncbi:MAG: ATP-grasp domain-containing protein [Planctomycetes bacterium]|nr:ATP-grasp domain-containing protein [Planctomycetota bacterium]